MCLVRCCYCKKHVNKLLDDGRCIECDKEYRTIVAGILKRYGGALKRLADR